MTLVLFLVVLVTLILVHELGHFVVAKWSGMRVDEFGIGFPPRLFARRIGETEYSINALPFGGFVRIYGEDGEADTASPGRAFTDKPRILQALVLVAGITMNIILAWVLILVALAAGMPKSLSPEEIPQAKDASLAVINVLPDSPAGKAGIVPGDTIVSIASDQDSFTAVDPVAFTTFVSEGEGAYALAITLKGEDGTERTVFATPTQGVVASNPEQAALGVSVAAIGTLDIPWYQAPLAGAKATGEIIVHTTIGLASFFASVFTLSADFSNIAGPIGIAGAVGSASSHGILALFSLAALISVNLAVINLLPIPALDGGRLLFVIIEGILRRPVSGNIQRGVNAAGFAFLILLMLVVTASDIFKILG